jgi:serine/threonine protein kinase
VLQKVPGLCPAGLDLLSRLLRFNPDERPSCAQALEHPYFDGFSPPPQPAAHATAAPH